MSRKMKDSGVEWIGEIPEDWEVRKLNEVANRITDFVASGSFASLNENVTYLDEPNYAMLIRTTDLSKKVNKKAVYISKDAYDFLKNSNLFGGEIILPNIGSVGDAYMYSPMYENASLAPNAILVDMKESNRFYYYYFSSPSTSEMLRNIGSDSVQLKFNKTQLRQIRVLRPPYDIQKEISLFLDTKVKAVDSIIERTNETINDYKSLKQSIITEAVTKGLNKDVEMKDSGIEWIGTIPNHWDVGKMKNYGKALIGLTYSPDNVTDKGKLVLRSSNVQNGKIDLNDSVFVDVKPKEHLLLKKNDILICARNGSKALVGKSALIPDELVGETFGAFMTVYRSIYNEFIYYVLNSSIFNYYIGAFSSSTINQLTTSTLNSIQLTIPPIEEQNHIVEYLRQRTGEIDRLIDYKIELLANLESYKKSLIYECVTGKREII